MGYKKAGFEVIGNVEIDPKMNDLYVRNNKPKYNYLEDLRDFNKREDLPEALFGIDILDGSPPCTSFSTVGLRDKTWGKKKKFKEGQTAQTLDDLFFVFLDTVEKLQPKIVLAENVTGIIKGKARGYINLVVKRLQDLGYSVQIFQLNAAHMDVPQARHRVFIIANNQGYGKLKLEFKNDVLLFGAVKTEHGRPITSEREIKLLNAAGAEDYRFADVCLRMTGHETMYSDVIVHDSQVCNTITGAGRFYRYEDKTKLSDEDIRRCSTFPSDYDFRNQNVQYVCGMSVPPNMMANIAVEIWEQWLS